MSVSGLATAQVFYMHMLLYSHWPMVIRMTWGMMSSTITATVSNPHTPSRSCEEVVYTDSENMIESDTRRDAGAALFSHNHSFAASTHRYLPAGHSLGTCWQTRS